MKSCFIESIFQENIQKNPNVKDPVMGGPSYKSVGTNPFLRKVKVKMLHRLLENSVTFGITSSRIPRYQREAIENFKKKFVDYAFIKNSTKIKCYCGSE